MSLRKKPYLPLYVRDWLSSVKLNRCTANAHGIMINTMLNMHMEEDYGCISLNDLVKQNDNQQHNQQAQAVSILCKLLPFERHEVEQGLDELLQRKILYLENNMLVCKRMVKDNEISELRSGIGKLGGDNSLGKKNKLAQAKVKANSKAKVKAKSDTEYESENETENKIKAVVDFLNLKTGKNFKSNGANVKFISGRLSEGYTVEDCKKVIENKCDEWLGGKMATYLRISTLFIPSHFEEYLNQTPIVKKVDIKKTEATIYE